MLGYADLICQECGRVLIRTSERYAVCPEAHGRLIQVREVVRVSVARREDVRAANLFSKALPAYVRSCRE